MSIEPLGIKSIGLVSSVGLTASATCAAIRGGISNAQETGFLSYGGEWFRGHCVILENPSYGFVKHVKMATMAISECLSSIPKHQWKDIPILLCLAEPDRPGRMENLDNKLLIAIQNNLGVQFALESCVVSKGHVSVAIALSQAKKLIYNQNICSVLIAAVDSLLSWPTLSAYDSQNRILMKGNSNGFIPGEGAGAVLIQQPSNLLVTKCIGIGMGTELAHINSEEPLRAEGLANAIRVALAEANLAIHDLDFRITDISGEQYYFKEAALAISRILKKRREIFDIWHPAQSIGETGAVSGIAILAVANASFHKNYANGSMVLAHMANDDGLRSALILQFGGD